MDRNTIVAFVLIGLIIVLMPTYMKWASPEDESIVDSTSVPLDVRPYQKPDSTILDETQTPDYSLSAPDIPSSSGDSFQPVVAWDAADPEFESSMVVVETPLYAAQFSTRGASVKSWRIKPTKPYLHETEELVRERDSDRNLVIEARGGRGLLRSAVKNFEVNKSRIDLEAGGDPDTLIFTLRFDEWKTLTETYIFYPDRYVVDLYIDSKGLGELTGAASFALTWGGGLAPTEKDSAQDNFYTEASYLMGRDKEVFKSKGKKIVEELPSGPAQWVSQRTKYFMLGLVPEQPASGVSLRTWPDELYNGKHLPKLFETGLLFNIPQGDINQKVILYFGPIEKSLLGDADESLVKAMSWGWPIIKPFSLGVLASLKFMHGFIPNYGVVLILFSIFVKIIVWPLTHKSHQSTKRMQLVQPLMKATQARYKGNAQKLQQEMGILYKKYKINPLGGCWPMLLQMPLLYSLFIVFRSTIELRGQPFMFWINDLSMPDILFHLPFSLPLYGDHVTILPLVMALSTFLQSKQTMTDPNQKAMLYMMPIMFIFIFNNFPSGLTLYYTLFNLMTWGQTKLMKVHDPELEKAIAEALAEAEAAEKKKHKKKKS